MGVNKPHKKPGKPVTPHNNPEPKSDLAVGQPPVVSHIPPTPPNPQNSTTAGQDNTPQWKKCLEIAAVIIAFGLLIINVFQLSCTSKAADAAKSAAQTADKSLKLSERAWINVSFDRMPASAELQIGQAVFVPIRVNNTGRTVAKKVHGYIVGNLLKIGEQPIFDYSPGHPRAEMLAGTVFPNSPSLPTPIPFIPMSTPDKKPKPIAITKEMQADLIAGRAHFIVHGRVTYSDIFDIEHWTTFCQVMRSSTDFASESDNYQPCIDYNDTDKN